LSEILPANFTISAAAKSAIEGLRVAYDVNCQGDPAAVVCVAWGIVVPDRGPPSQGVVVTFYPASMREAVAHGIQTVSGVDLIFFTTQEFRMHFEGKVLDHAPHRGFFLRAGT
jgi:hypothetical protein